MISLIGVYHVVEAIVPLYVAMILAYASVKCWKLFTPDQCSGINMFVSKFSVPLLSFRVISGNNPSRVNLDCVITTFALSTLPNTLIVGIPILKSMYGNEAAELLAQIIVLQTIIWYNLLLFLFEFRAARAGSATTLSEVRVELEVTPGTQSKEREEEEKDRSPSVNTKLILLTVGRKLISNPNTYATLLGIIWSMISFRWGLKLPIIVDKSVSILADGGLGMAMFSLGLFMASQASILACGTWLVVLAMVAKFLVGPASMAVASFAIGFRSTLLRISIVQAALPQGIVPFVFAKEYNVHPKIVSAGVSFGMLITVPIALAYYFLLEL